MQSDVLRNAVMAAFLEEWLYSEGRLFYHFYNPNLTPSDPQDEGSRMPLSE